VNYYTRCVVALGDEPQLPSAWPGSESVRWLKRDLPKTDMGWEIDPDGLAQLLRDVYKISGELPLYITENGAAYPEFVDDQDRIARCSTCPPVHNTLARYFPCLYSDYSCLAHCCSC
jgi:beta-glucosidase